MIAILLLFLLVINGSFFASAVFHRRFEETLPISCGGIPILLYFLGMAFGLLPGFYLVLILSLLIYGTALGYITVKKSF